MLVHCVELVPPWCPIAPKMVRISEGAVIDPFLGGRGHGVGILSPLVQHLHAHVRKLFVVIEVGASLRVRTIARLVL